MTTRILVVTELGLHTTYMSCFLFGMFMIMYGQNCGDTRNAWAIFFLYSCYDYVWTELLWHTSLSFLLVLLLLLLCMHRLFLFSIIQRGSWVFSGFPDDHVVIWLSTEYFFSTILAVRNRRRLWVCCKRCLFDIKSITFLKILGSTNMVPSRIFPRYQYELKIIIM